MSTIAQLLALHCKLDSDSARLDTELLIGHALGKDRSYLYSWPEKEVEAEIERRFTALFDRRVKGEPVAHILGYREFWSLTLAVNNSTLIPRPETETLIEWVTELGLPKCSRVLDLGTGSGAIALALAMENPDWEIDASDISSAAVALATENASRLQVENVRLQVSDWYQSVSAGAYDLIVSNPPYIKANDEHLQKGDLRFEPVSALVADNMGLADLEKIIAGAGAFLADGGWLLLEHGYEQAPAVRAMLKQFGFSGVLTRCDLSGNDRISGGVFSYG
ncbi:peptide chain release factor N(5)-glutamine methyltransferase [Halieaceae bacterium]|jgi:release factor glutamine methyltransferase|nr:peptide chain release factor N(5)-glutamine methyltransferase [Halieaceae bacterium]